MHPAALGELTAGHIGEPAAEAGDGLLAAIVLIRAFGLVLAVTHHTFAVS